MMDAKSLNVLIADPDKNDALALQRELETDDKLVFKISVVSSMSEARNFMNTETFDIIIACLDLADTKGFDTIAAFHKSAPGIPFLALLKPEEQELIQECISLGAQDCIIKGTSELTLPQRSLFHAIERRNSFQKLRALDDIKTQFTSMMTHELRTPLVSIKGFVTLLLHEVPGKINTAQKEYLGIILKNTERQLRMITEMLDNAKIEAGAFSVEKKKSFLIELLNRTVIECASLANEKEIRLSVESGADEIPVEMDDYRISQVILNLLNNSIKFAPKGSRILLRVSVAAAEKLRIPEAFRTKQPAPGTYALVSITDEGEGISREDLGRLFSAFSQVSKSKENREKGTGLGLSISKSIVEAHGGLIWVESEGKGKGTVFTFILPVG